jgi:hypothetical protein
VESRRQASSCLGREAVIGRDSVAASSPRSVALLLCVVEESYVPLPPPNVQASNLHLPNVQFDRMILTPCTYQLWLCVFCEKQATLWVVPLSPRNFPSTTNLAPHPLKRFVASARWFAKHWSPFGSSSSASSIVYMSSPKAARSTECFA